jgi:hypothetical protein
MYKADTLLLKLILNEKLDYMLLFKWRPQLNGANVVSTSGILGADICVMFMVNDKDWLENFSKYGVRRKFRKDQLFSSKYIKERITYTHHRNEHAYTHSLLLYVYNSL